jgi:hypothetical protein
MALPQISFDLISLSQVADESSLGYWVSLGIDLVIATIIGGFVLIAVLAFFNKIYGQLIDYKNAFLVTLTANTINMLFLPYVMDNYLQSIPFIGIIAPILIWLLLVRGVFEEITFMHAFLVSIVFYVLTIVAIPFLTGTVKAYIGV